MDSGNHPRQLQTVNLAALKLLIEQLAGLADAQRQGFVVDIFHQYRHAFPCGLVRDTAAHNACAQHGGLLRGLDVLGQLFRLAFDILIVQEDAHQRAGFVGMG